MRPSRPLSMSEELVATSLFVATELWPHTDALNMYPDVLLMFPRVSPYDRRPVLPTSQACARVWSAQGRRKCSGLGGGGKGGETPTGPLPELTKIPPKEPRAARNALRKDREARGVWPSVLLSCIGRGMSGEFRPLFRMQRQIVKNRPVHVIRRVKIYDCTKFQASPIGHSRKIRYFVEMSVTPFI